MNSHRFIWLVCCFSFCLGCASRPPVQSSSRYLEEWQRSVAEREQQRSDARVQWQQFLSDNADLAPYASCALRVAAYGQVDAWEHLGRAARELCIPPPRWIFVGSTSSGRFWVDNESLALRTRDKVDAWTRSDYPVYGTKALDSKIVVASRDLYDCDKMQIGTLSIVTYDAGGGPQTSSFGPVTWESAPPGSLLEAKLTLLCAYRSAQLSGRHSSTPLRKWLGHGFVDDSPPSQPTQDEIDAALKKFYDRSRQH